MSKAVDAAVKYLATESLTLEQLSLEGGSDTTGALSPSRADGSPPPATFSGVFAAEVEAGV